MGSTRTYDWYVIAQYQHPAHAGVYTALLLEVCAVTTWAGDVGSEAA